MKRLLYLFSVLIISGCAGNTTGTIEVPKIPADWQEINLSNFRLMAPPQWTMQNPGGSEEAFVGGIVGPGVSLSFNYSTTGTASRLLSPEKDYINKYEWWDGEGSFPFTGTTKKMHLPTPAQKDRFPMADYMADLKNGNRFVSIPITLPTEIRTHNFKIDSNDKYVFKTIWPKVTGKGMTGVYIKSRTDNFNFEIQGRDLKLKDQEAVLLSFRTIQFKRDQ